MAGVVSEHSQRMSGNTSCSEEQENASGTSQAFGELSLVCLARMQADAPLQKKKKAG